jgi:hypothetical protein
MQNLYYFCNALDVGDGRIKTKKPQPDTQPPSIQRYPQPSLTKNPFESNNMTWGTNQIKNPISSSLKPKSVTTKPDKTNQIDDLAREVGKDNILNNNLSSQCIRFFMTTSRLTIE